MPDALTVTRAVGKGAATRAPLRLAPVRSTRNVVGRDSAGQSGGSTFVIEGGAAQARDNAKNQESAERAFIGWIVYRGSRPAGGDRPGDRTVLEHQAHDALQLTL